MDLEHLLKFNIGMRIASLNRPQIAFFMISLGLSIAGFAFYSFFVSQNYITNGFEITDGREDDRHILRNGERVIDSTVLDFQVLDNNVLGIRLPAQRLVCDDGSGYKIRLVNRPEYFILTVDNGEIQKFHSREKFINKLSSDGVSEDISLDFSLTSSVWERYSRYYEKIDFSNCSKLE